MVRAFIDESVCRLRGHEWILILKRSVGDGASGSDDGRYKRCMRCGERSRTLAEF